MKKLALTLAVLLSGTAVFAQTGFSWGPKAGLNVSNLTNSEGDYKASIHAGVFAEFSVNEFFSIQPEILYSRQGNQYNLNGADVYARFNYFNIPILARIYFLEKMSLDLGPQIGFVLNAKAKAKADGTTVKTKIPSSSYNSVDFSFPIGLSYNFDMGLILSARYNVGITNVMKKDDFGKNKNSVFLISAGWRF